MGKYPALKKIFLNIISLQKRNISQIYDSHIFEILKQQVSVHNLFFFTTFPSFLLWQMYWLPVLKAFKFTFASFKDYIFQPQYPTVIKKHSMYHHSCLWIVFHLAFFKHLVNVNWEPFKTCNKSTRHVCLKPCLHVYRILRLLDV